MHQCSSSSQPGLPRCRPRVRHGARLLVVALDKVVRHACDFHPAVVHAHALCAIHSPAVKGSRLLDKVAHALRTVTEERLGGRGHGVVNLPRHNRARPAAELAAEPPRGDGGHGSDPWLVACVVGARVPEPRICRHQPVLRSAGRRTQTSSTSHLGRLPIMSTEPAGASTISSPGIGARRLMPSAAGPRGLRGSRWPLTKQHRLKIAFVQTERMSTRNLSGETKESVGALPGTTQVPPAPGRDAEK